MYAPIEREWRWLGGRPYWWTLFVIAAAIVAGAGLRASVVVGRHAPPQEAFLYGQPEIVPGTPTAYRAYVRNGRTAVPLPNARVQVAVRDGAGTTVWETSARTDARGMVEILPDVPVDAPEGSYTVRLDAASETGQSSITRQVAVARAFRVLVTTDKPLYQPGQVIHIRALTLAKADLRPVARRDAVFTVLDAKGNTVFKHVQRTSEFGIASADFTLADQVNTGDYTVRVTLDDTASERHVTVRRYALPKFAVSLVPDRTFYAPGETVECTLEAEYTFGKPVAGGTVRIVASEFVEKLRPFATVEGTTDAEGRFHGHIPLKTHFVGQERTKGDAFVSLEAEVTDTAGHSQKTSLDPIVTTRPIRIDVFPESGALVRNVENIVYLVTAYPDGRPARTTLTVGKTGETLQTSEVGIAKVALTPTTPRLQLTVEAVDEFGVRAEVTRALDVDARTETVLLRTDRAVYRTGATATLTVLAPTGTGRVFVDVVKDHRTVLMRGVDVRGGSAELALDLPPDLFGTVELHAYRLAPDGNMVGDTKVIQVTRADDLRIAATLDKQVYGPAARAILECVVTRPNGDPIQAALGLAGVDEAVFALQEMQPGLERVYFMLQEEILKPRYEIHAHAPYLAQQAVEDGPPEEQELEEAAVILFSAAGGTALPARVTSETFRQKDQRLRDEEESYLRRVLGGLALVPGIGFLAVALPLLIYTGVRAVRGIPIGGWTAEAEREFSRATRRLLWWWALGFYLPILGVITVAIGFAGLLYGNFDLPLEALPLVQALGPGVLTALGMFLVFPKDCPPVGRLMSRNTVRLCSALLVGGAVMWLSLYLPVVWARSSGGCEIAILILSVLGIGLLISLGVLFGAIGRSRTGQGRPEFKWDLWGVLIGIGGLVWLLYLSLDLGEEGFIIVFVAGLLVLVALARQIVWTRRLRGHPAIGAAPHFQALIRSVPAGYVLSIFGMTAVVAAGDVWPPVLNQDVVCVALLTLIGVAIAMVGAVAATATGLVQRISLARWLGVAFSRSLLVGLPCFIPLLLPTLARSSARVQSMPLSADLEGWDSAGVERFLMEDLSGGSAYVGRPGGRPEFSMAPAQDGVPPADVRAPARIRRYFPETLFWRPEVITDARGRARLEIPLADSITTWRIGMNAVSAAGELGSGTQGLRVFQDFFVDIDFPVALTQHDRISVPVAVYNYLDSPQRVRLEVEAASWFTLEGADTRTLEIGANEVTSVPLTIEALEPGQHTLLVRAYGSRLADAVERRVRVEPDGQPVVQTINGRLDRALTREFEIPEDAIPGANDLIVKIYPGAFSQVLEGLDAIFRMPFGCFEQTSSTTYPNVLVLEYMRRTNQIKPEIELKALNYINLGYQRLLTFEVPGGGFEWFGHAPAHTVLTAYGLLEFTDMAKVYEVEPAVIDRTRNWLFTQQETDGSWSPAHDFHGGATAPLAADRLRTTAYVAWALAESGVRDVRLATALEYVVQHVKAEDDPYTLAVCANALIAGKRPEAPDLLARADALKLVEGKLVHWSSTGQGLTYSSGSVLDIEATALIASAYLQARYATTTAHKALAWLVEQKDAYGTWYSTQATVHAMRALLAGAGPSGGLDGDVRVAIVANGTLAKDLVVTPETSDVFRLVSLREFVRPGHNTIALDTVGTGALAYQIVATHYVPWLQVEPAPQPELTIAVDYDTTSVAAADLLTARVTVTYHRPGAAQMVIVDLGVPPGFEVMPDGFTALQQQGRIERFTQTGRQVILYLRELEGGAPFTFTYTLRAKYPVAVQSPRSQAYLYYETEVRAESAPVGLEVL